MTSSRALFRRAATNGTSRQQQKQHQDETSAKDLCPSATRAVAACDDHSLRRITRARQVMSTVKVVIHFMRANTPWRKICWPTCKATNQHKLPAPRKNLICFLVLVNFCTIMWHFESDGAFRRSADMKHWSQRPRQQSVPILVQSFSDASEWLRPLELSPKLKDLAKPEDYGGLNIAIVKEEVLQRNRPNRDDDVVDYYAIDDDYFRNQFVSFPGDSMAPVRQCRRTNWHRLVFPTCNIVHELAMADSSNLISYLSHGGYRDVFTKSHHFLNLTDEVVIKQYKQDLDIKYDSFEYVRMDALVSERLTSNPRIADIFSHCGLAVVAEYFHHGDIENVIVPPLENNTWHFFNESHEAAEKIEPLNNLTSSEKLQMALEMAEAIAALHSFQDGIIVHNDIQPSQFLFGADGKTLKLNDFNRAEIMLWDDEHHRYCRYRNGKGMGNYRSPEEYYDKPLNEKIDTWSFGNILYSVVTGRHIYYYLDTDEEAQAQIKYGVWSILDPRYRARSFADKTLVELMELCWEYVQFKRVDMFEIVTKLRKAVVENDSLKLEQQ